MTCILRFSLALLGLTLFASGLSAQACEHPDYAPLEKFFESTNGPAWSRNDGWLTDCSPCEWFGVGCNEAGRVTTLTLRGNQLAGELPAQIGDLDFLRFIQLGYNEIGGSLPAEMFELDSIRTIYLGGNQFSGELPTTIGTAIRLERLELYRNSLTGELPGSITGLLSLRILSLGDNQLSGRIPEGLGDLPAIRGVYLANNDFEGCFPADLAMGCSSGMVTTGGNPRLAWMGDYGAFCASDLTGEQTGAPCDDGDDRTAGDAIDASCNCAGLEDPDGQSPGVGGVGGDDQTVINFAPPSGDLTQGLSTPTGTGSQPGLGTPPAAVLAYPNPLSGNELTVKLPTSAGFARLRLLSLNGRVFAEQSTTAVASQLEVPKLPQGMYLLEVTTAEGRTQQPIVVK